MRRDVGEAEHMASRRKPGFGPALIDLEAAKASSQVVKRCSFGPVGQRPEDTELSAGGVLGASSHELAEHMSNGVDERQEGVPPLGELGVSELGKLGLLGQVDRQRILLETHENRIQAEPTTVEVRFRGQEAGPLEESAGQDRRGTGRLGPPA